jgi:protein-L-isoaspartate(D-aspartate) O-methyltransferase
MQEQIHHYYEQLDRRFFIDQNKDLAHIDGPLSIGFGQTISQPSLVLKMTLLLQPDPHFKTLEIGTGSGYQTALLAKFSREVFTVERIPQLYYKATNRLQQMPFKNIHFKLDDGTLGWPEFAPFDRIMVTAAARYIPPALIQQLASPGRMIIPVGGAEFQELLSVTKNESGDVTTTCEDYVRFVPLIGKYETPKNP